MGKHQLPNGNGAQSATIIFLGVLCFIQFCFIIAYVAGDGGYSLPNLDYSDFLTVLFTAITLILSMLAVIVGVMAFIGWQGFHSNVQRLTHKFIREGFDEGGELREILREEVDAIATSGIESIYVDEEQK